MRPRLPAGARFSRDATLLMAVSGLFCVSFMGAHALLRVLYVLRLGHGPEYLGLFSAAGAFTFMAMSLPGGALGERFGAGRVMLAGGITHIAGMAMLPMTELVPLWLRGPWPIVSQIVLIAGWSALSVNLVPALMAATTADNRSGAYAVNTALRSLGTLVGTVVGGALPGLFAGLLQQGLDGPGPYRYGLWVVVAVGLTGLIPLTLLRHLRQAPVIELARADDRFPMFAMAVVVVHVLLAHGGWATVQSFGNAYMDTDLRLPAASIGLITGLSQLAAFLASLAMPRLAARHGNGWILTVTTLGMGASLLPQALIPHWTAAGLGRVALQAFDAMWMPALQVFQMEWVSARWRSLAYGVASTAMGLSFALVSLLGGLLSAAAGYRTVFLVGAVLSTAGAAVFWLDRGRHGSGRAKVRASSVAAR